MIKNLTFKFKKNIIVKNLDTKIIKGVPFIIKGNSGIGKSTLANLISGIYEPESGSIIFREF